MSNEVELSLIDLPADLLREGTPDVSDILLSAADPEIGIFQPILLRPGDVQGRYFLVAGKRRYTAAQQLGFKTIPAHVLEHLSTSKARLAELIENLARRDLPPHKEALGVIEALRLAFEAEGMEVPTEEVKSILWRLANEHRGVVEKRASVGLEGEVVSALFDKLGRSFSGFVTGIMPALSWPEDVREAMERGMSKASAQALAQIKDDTMRQEALKRVSEGEKAKEVKKDILGAAKSHKQLTGDLTHAELLRNWKVEDGWLIPDLVAEVPEPSGMEVVPRESLVSEALASLYMQPEARVVMLMADVEDIIAALRYGVRVWSAHTQPRFEGEHDATPPVMADSILLNQEIGDAYEQEVDDRWMQWTVAQKVPGVVLTSLKRCAQCSVMGKQDAALVGVTATASGGNRASLALLF